jgi:hypothetical protein
VGILVLFLIFFPREEDEDGCGLPIVNGHGPLGDKAEASWRTALLVAATCLIHGIACVLISFWLVVAHPDYLLTWANILGICAAGLALVQYFPQIWTTWRLRHVGSLSIPMMTIQTPGSFVWAASLAARVGMEGWSTWGVYLVTGCLQGCLLAMGIMFEYQARKAGQENGRDEEGDRFGQAHLETDDEGHVVVESVRPRDRRREREREGGERTPLLGRGSRSVSRKSSSVAN